jgi:hypothetical protein
MSDECDMAGSLSSRRLPVLGFAICGSGKSKPISRLGVGPVLAGRGFPFVEGVTDEQE